MPQDDKPTLAWAVVKPDWGYAPEVREIIGRTPKSVRVRASGWWMEAGQLVKRSHVRAEFQTREEAEAALARWHTAYKAATPAVDAAREAARKADDRHRDAISARNTAALAALKETV